MPLSLSLDSSRPSAASTSGSPPPSPTPLLQRIPETDEWDEEDQWNDWEESSSCYSSDEDDAIHASSSRTSRETGNLLSAVEQGESFSRGFGGEDARPGAERDDDQGRKVYGGAEAARSLSGKRKKKKYWEGPEDGSGDRGTGGALAKGKLTGRASAPGGVQDAVGIQPWEVALEIAAQTLSPGALLMPVALASTGLKIGLPILFLTAGLSWFSAVVLVVEGRYVGGTSIAQIAQAVFPRRLGGRILAVILAELWLFLASGGRTVVVLSIIVDIISTLFKESLPSAGLLHSGAFVTTIITLFYIVLPVSRKPHFYSTSLISRLAALSAVFWVIALAVIGAWSKGYAGPKYPKPESNVRIWQGIAMIVFSLTAPQSTFALNTSMRRPASRHDWAVNTFIGYGAAAIVSAAWGLIGVLGLDLQLPASHVFSRLPSHPAVNATRIISILILLISLPTTLIPARDSLSALVFLPFSAPAIVLPSRRRRRPGVSRRHTGSGGFTLGEQADPEAVLEKAKKDWKARNIVNPLTWVVVAVVTVCVGLRKGDARGRGVGGGLSPGADGVAEVTGVIGSSVTAFVLPASFFIVLFHVRKARSIFIRDPRREGVRRDTLLLKKELELQKRLSGRRIWQDLLVFGALGPFGLVVLIKGIGALFMA